MKHTTKTAIEIMTEEDNKTFEKFFRSIQGDCENLIGYPLSKGDVIYLTSFNKIAQMFSSTKKELKKRGYTILKGVPQNWREESEIPTFEDWFENLTRTESDELEKKYGYYGHDISTTEDEWLGIYNDEFGIKQNKDNSISISKLTETNSRLDQLESENKELRECLKFFTLLNEDAYSSIIGGIKQAKQLLNK